MDLDGVILIDKPRGWTSHDVVARIRRLTRWEKVGHFGSLDPLATGLLLLGIGVATRLFPVLSRLEKAYVGRIRLGLATDTYDAEGQAVAPPSSDFPNQEKLIQTMKSFEGEIEQVPPPFSAKKYRGRPLYKLARKGKAVPLKPVKIRIHRFQLLNYEPPDISFELICSSGTYVRSLAHDLGQTLGCGAHVAELTRVGAGPFKLENALTLAQLEELLNQNRIGEALVPLEKLFEELPKAILLESPSPPLAKGRTIPQEAIRVLLPPSSLSLGETREEKIIRIFSPEGRFLALARPASTKGHLIPFLLLD